jgi:altronate dehydratase large subunit
MIGLESVIALRGKTPELGKQLHDCVVKAARYYAAMGHASFSPGNADGGLTTMEEKSVSSYSKGGSQLISGILKPAEKPTGKGLFLLDVVPDGAPKFGYPNINDTAEIVELISCGCHMILFITGRGSVVGSVLAPVIKITGNPYTYQRMRGDMDVHAGTVLLGEQTLDEAAIVLEQKVLEVAQGTPSMSEQLGHQEFALGYKTFQKCSL